VEAIELCSLVRWEVFVAYFIADKIFEYWLGKTNKVKAGSILEIIINGIKAVFKKGE
jgi:hypothetical protein